MLETTGTEMELTNVVQLRRNDECAPLTADECRRVRAMLAQFDAIVHNCPVARMILEKE
jgi:hypothetical protein